MQTYAFDIHAETCFNWRQDIRLNRHPYIVKGLIVPMY